MSLRKMMIRAYRETDAPQIAALLAAVWPEDPVMVEMSALHGSDVDGERRMRRTLVAEEDGEVLGSATLLATARHPTIAFFTAAVAPEHRRCGIASAMFENLRACAADRSLLARVRETDDAGIAFLRAHTLTRAMRSRTVTVDPSDRDVVAWTERRQRPLELERPAERDQVARAHECAYARVHAAWAPSPQRPLQESLLVFCGEGWLPESAVLARENGELVGVGSLYGAPNVFAKDGLFLIADTIRADQGALRSLVAAQLEWARPLRMPVSFEADEENAELWELLHELPARSDPVLLLLLLGTPES